MKGINIVFAIVFGLCALLRVDAQEVQCAQTISAQCPNPDPVFPIYFGVPEHCQQFCECSAQLAWLQVCGAGEAWDTVRNICDWRESVDCGARPYP